MPDHLDDYYQVLVDQSKTDHIYTLIHNGLSHDFIPKDPDGFVLVNPNELVDILKPFNQKHVVKEISIRNKKYVMLKNRALTNYLEAGFKFEEVESKPHRYALLHFFPTKKDLAIQRTNLKRYAQENLRAQLFEEDKQLLTCWHYIVKRIYKRRALNLARKGHIYLDARRKTTSNKNEIIKISTGYNILSIAYSWNNCFKEAAITDAYYIFNKKLYPYMQMVISPYLEMLIAKKQYNYLQALFENADLKRYFLAHYEAYISLAVNPHYRCKKMNEMIDIINRINNYMQAYVK